MSALVRAQVLGIGAHPVTSFNLSHLLRGLVSKYGHTER